ncbi:MULTISPECIES: ABC transporter ATP-binding protein [unclassified Devosia]|uniref:ABC transporter ATP-binding protein n=1 Tax=unclassified Devosia TaxID=196773 RepID=UPI00086EFD13|nr:MULTISPECIES: ABC transporter ATP-binding protein [unclassified Devosia]MBN9364401.1 ABC transporter ATP-binding protein [Devosia sp.]ODS87026.1 MAG: ABC transporter ATP-binding protein [Devosia sp. SCN 66-27]OJX20812.1 MAG: ABC transporter ATP-binding protein [Devosia sp. 66-14]
MTTVQLNKLSRYYGTYHALRDVSLSVQSGEFIVLLGPSGCGKSTLLSAIAGLDDLQGGQVLLDNQDVTKQEPSRRNIGMVFQSYALYPTMTARQNLSFGLEVARTPKAEINQRVEWAAQVLQLTPLLNRKPGQLSGGQRQRVAIGRALVRKSNLFLFDEPLSNLDAKLRTEMRVEIKALHERLGATFIYVTHDQIEAMTLASKIAVMRSGVIEQFGPPEELYDRPASLFVADFLGSPSMNQLAGTLRVEDGRVFVEHAGGRSEVTGYPFAAPPKDGLEVVLGLRPEQLSIGEGGGAGRLTVRLLLIEPLGADSLAWCEVGGQRMSVRVPPALARSLSGELPVSFAPATVSLFDKTIGHRL